ncbi:MAG TPA: alpha/beta hydrolase [candidate division Zixibacteria bacterium]|nr:alpha/beta hydrolase [candidate division Zixibacteria bacterium]
MAVERTPISGGVIESYLIPGGPGVPLLVLGGVESGLRPLAGTEQVLRRRWDGRARRRSVLVVGRPMPDDPADADLVMHPRLIADAVATAIRDVEARGGPRPPFAVEAESGGGRISLWLAVDHPQLVSRLVLASVAAETPPDSPMAPRMRQWIELAEQDRWAEFFGRLAGQMRPAQGSAGADAFQAAARLQPRPTTPERFLGELRTTLDPSSFVTSRLGEITVPALVLAGGRDQVVPEASVRLVAERLPNARLEVDPDCGHTVRGDFRGYDELVEAFLAEGDATRGSDGPAPEPEGGRAR